MLRSPTPRPGRTSRNRSRLGRGPMPLRQKGNRRAPAGWTSRGAATIVRAHFGPGSMKDYLVQFFTWWNGSTLGTRFYTWRFGQFVGEDELGNRYYRYTQAHT